MNLKKIREEIDSIDIQLVNLLCRRMNCSINVAEVKCKESLPVLNSQREQQILEKVQKMGGNFGNYLYPIYQAIMESSRDLQSDVLESENAVIKEIEAARKDISNYTPPANVLCQGVEGAFSHEAAKCFYPNSNIDFCSSFADVFKAVDSGTAVVGVVPVENSSAGSVSDVYDLILKYRHYIIGAVNMKIEQNLLGLKGAKLSDIKTVYSQPHALAQCDEFIEKNQLIAEKYINTAAAAQMVSKKGDIACAAIGSKQAAKLYGLEIIEPSIQTNQNNITRFIAVSKRLIIQNESDKISLAFTLPHEKGSLSNTLTRFTRHGFNLTKIESRPTGEPFEYQFYLDFTGDTSDLNTIRLLASLFDEMPQFTFLGNYKEMKI